MMKTFFTFLILFLSIDLFPCSSFFINHGSNKILCFNWDYLSDGNGFVFINQPNVNKKAFQTDNEKVLTWTSKYGSVSFNQIGREFPYCGLNQAGLAISIMSNTAMIYPKKDDRYILNESQWVQYLLDNCKTIDDVQHTNSLIQVIGVATPLHYLIADANGDAAVVEYINGKLKFYRNDELPYSVLENSFYNKSLDQYKSAISGKENQKSRFTKMCYALEDVKKNNSISNFIDYSFDILNKVEQKITRWQIVLDIAKLEVYFNTSEPNYQYLIKNTDGSFTPTNKETNIKTRIGSTKSKRTKVSFDTINFNCNNRILFRKIKDQQNVAFIDYINNVDEDRIYLTIDYIQKGSNSREMPIKSIKEYIKFIKNYECK